MFKELFGFVEDTTKIVEPVVESPFKILRSITKPISEVVQDAFHESDEKHKEE